MITFLIILLACAFLVFLVRLMHRRGAENDTVGLYRRLQPVYLPALLNLLNPDDLAFLRTSLRHSDFVELKRRRTRALIDYVRRINTNAKVLTSIGAILRQSPVPDVAMSGQLLASRALTTRMLAGRTLLFLEIELLLPFFDTNLASTIRAYETARARLEGVTPSSLAARYR